MKFIGALICRFRGHKWRKLRKGETMKTSTWAALYVPAKLALVSADAQLADLCLRHDRGERVDVATAAGLVAQNAILLQQVLQTYREAMAVAPRDLGIVETPPVPEGLEVDLARVMVEATRARERER